MNNETLSIDISNQIAKVQSNNEKNNNNFNDNNWGVK